MTNCGHQHKDWVRFVGDQDEQYIDAVYQRFDGKRNYVSKQKEELD